MDIWIGLIAGALLVPVGWFARAGISEIRETRIAKAIRGKAAAKATHKPAANPFEDKLAFGRKRRREEVQWFYEAWDRIEPRYAQPSTREGYRRDYLIERAEREWHMVEIRVASEQRMKLRTIERERKARQ